MCGEQYSDPGLRPAYYGSSPRVRGTAGRERHQSGMTRFIPACAGNSSENPVLSASLAVHPRVCGEQRRHDRSEGPDVGSSPRVRGTGEKMSPEEKANRFIPACAGNSRGGVRGGRAPPVHPRVCGEQPYTMHALARSNGSSPRVRGTVCDMRNHVVFRRFIPACAGNSDYGPFDTGRSSVHPRVCGEQFTLLIAS